MACAGEAPVQRVPEPSPAPPVGDPVIVEDAGDPVALADAAPAPADAAPPLDVASELAWAKSRWPQALAGVERVSPVSELVAWAPAQGTLDVWVRAEGVECRPGTLARAGTEELELAVVLEEHKQGASVTRKVSSGRVGARFQLSRSGNELRRTGSGEWESIGGFASSGTTHYAALSSVSAESVLFAGQWLEVEPSCSTEELPCPSGGSRTCATCKDIVLAVTEGSPHLGKKTPVVRLSSCKEPCPAAVENPDLARAKRLFDDLEVFRVAAIGPSVRASLHRSLAACRRSK